MRASNPGAALKSGDFKSSGAHFSTGRLNCNMKQWTLGALAVVLLAGCLCEDRPTIQLDNRDRLWCNCEVTFPNGDVYVIEAGETRTYEVWSGIYTLDACCDNNAFENSLCGMEECNRTKTFDLGCGDYGYWDLSF